MEPSIEDLLARGKKALDSGQYHEAEQSYTIILTADPNHADANHGMGLLAFTHGKNEQALGYIGAALKSSPDNGLYWYTFIDCLLRLGMLDNARAAFDQARCQGLGADHLEQIESLLANIDSDQESCGIHTNGWLNRKLKQAQKKARRGLNAEAVLLYQEIIGAFPGNQQARDGLARLLASSAHKDGDDAALSKRKSEELGRLLEKGQFNKALEMADSLLKQFPHSVPLYNVKGVALSQLNQHDLALQSFRQALELAPDFAQSYCYMGTTFQEIGDLEAARSSFARAVDIDKNHVEAHRELSMLKHFENEDEQLRTMKALNESKDLPANQRYRLCFALSKAYEDLGELEKSVTYLQQGNAIRKGLLGYDFSRDQKLFESIYQYHEILTADKFSPVNASNEITPIFVLGMPRSGTTLVEQILSSHSLVGAAGEVEQITILGKAIVQEKSRLSDKVIEDFRAIYKSSLQARSEQAGLGDRRLIVDKMPQNFLFVNLICTLFPEAWIIHVERDPCATCWSNYKQDFATDSIGYCYDMDDLLAYYGLYTRLMNFWHKFYPDRIYRLDYEALVANPQAETCKLVDHLGLKWDDRLLSPQKNKRIARTASQQQVRKSIYKGSSQQWRKFEPYLNGAFDRLLQDSHQDIEGQ